MQLIHVDGLGTDCRKSAAKPARKGRAASLAAGSRNPPPPPPLHAIKYSPAKLPTPPSPSVTSTIRVYGDVYAATGPLEGNMCSILGGSCGVGARVELLVSPSATSSASAAASSSGRVWAPLCFKNSRNISQDIADLACHQFYGWPSRREVYSIRGSFSDSFLIPSPGTSLPGPVKAGAPLFNVSSHTHWVTVLGLGKAGGRKPRSVQKLKFQVSTKPCDSSLLFNLQCDVLMTAAGQQR
ncbi:hypothetical protein PLESTB_000390100 [Pleodorina starrii]|uniref:SRCR domain-containing protein n=1 Tax=Pleodorina starrii TaxID=330485 RepID=A0A9W6BEX1_9CHLO|nr:hypothetical protein PLESTM_000861800 [Pleodorina starrii]GLC50530.1 hypothetical protein PLESTB_000390100 [Pleodorina starrii]GLC73232.1 hypothetical protein PLESTF_001349700 [Pleodorina starrii]